MLFRSISVGHGHADRVQGAQNGGLGGILVYGIYGDAAHCADQEQGGSTIEKQEQGKMLFDGDRCACLFLSGIVHLIYLNTLCIWAHIPI